MSKFDAKSIELERETRELDFLIKDLTASIDDVQKYTHQRVRARRKSCSRGGFPPNLADPVQPANGVQRVMEQIGSVEAERFKPLTSCQFCGGGDFSVLQQLGGQHRVGRCQGCGTVQLVDRLDEQAVLERYSSQGYFDGELEVGYQRVSYQDQQRAKEKTFAHLLRAIGPCLSGRQAMLEVGCGYGYLLKMAQGQFANIYATDFSQAAIESSRPYATQLWQGGLDDVDLAPGSLDLLVANHVIEHLYDMKSFLLRVFELLRPGGVVALTTPNFSSPLRWLLRDKWPSWKFPEHVTFFEAKTLSQAVSAAGFGHVQVGGYREFFPMQMLHPSLGDRPLWVPTTSLLVTGRKDS